MKILVCARCKKEVCEMLKGKIKTDAVVLCGTCNYKLLLLENSDKQTSKENPLSDIFGAFNNLKPKDK